MSFSLLLLTLEWCIINDIAHGNPGVRKPFLFARQQLALSTSTLHTVTVGENFLEAAYTLIGIVVPPFIKCYWLIILLFF